MRSNSRWSAPLFSGVWRPALRRRRLLTPWRPARTASAISATMSRNMKTRCTTSPVSNDMGYTQLVIADPGSRPEFPARYLKFHPAILSSARRNVGAASSLNLAEQRLFYFPPGGGTVETFPIGVGVQGWSTPLGATRSGRKAGPPGLIAAGFDPPPKNRNCRAYVPPGPDNPLGDTRCGSAGKAISPRHQHALGVGRDSSHGCIALP